MSLPSLALWDGSQLRVATKEGTFMSTRDSSCWEISWVSPEDGAFRTSRKGHKDRLHPLCLLETPEVLERCSVVEYLLLLEEILDLVPSTHDT